MSSELAAALVLLLCAVPLLMVAVAARRTRLLLPAGLGISVAAVGIAFLQTGALQRGSLASTDVVHLLPAQPFTDRCQQTFDLLVESRVVLAPPAAEGLVVRGELWDQLPANVQDAVKACAIELAAPEGDTDEIEIIRR